MSDFVESDHPRDADGKFGSGGGAAKSSSRLTADEKSTLSSYSGDDFLRINKELREGKANDPAVKRLDSAIAKSHIPSGTTLYRGMTMDAAKKLFPDGNITRGMTVSDPAFLSTSKSSAVAGSIGLGGVVLKIDTGSNAAGLDMAGHSRNESEQEVLLPRDAKLTVVGVTPPKSPGAPVVVRVSYGNGEAISDSVDSRTGQVEVDTRLARAAGILFASPGDRVLLVHRTDGQGWAFPGGGIEDGENAEEAARRELFEETGVRYDGPLAQWTRRQKDGVDFTTFLAEAPEGVEFVPQLNAEHDAFEWTERSAALSRTDLHPGARITLLRKDLDELEIAKAIRAGELTSPQYFGNLLLIALRITGTGASYRAGIDQYVWRDPSIYLNDHFLERCNGLPVVWEHPKDKPALDTEDFRKRIIGTILLPYIESDEVWGIAKILDMDAAQLLCTEQLSTSPCVVFVNQPSGEKVRMEDGNTLLVEGAPRLLDHLAVVTNGVWDKEGPPTGVANEGTISISDSTQSEESVMPDQIAPVAQPDSGSITNSKEGETLDKILACLDSMKNDHKALCSRMDAYEAKGKEPVTEEGNLKQEGEPAPVVADAKKDGEAQPGKESEQKALTEERTENGLSKNDTATEPMMDSKADAAIKALQDQLAILQKRIPTELRDEDRQMFVAAQMKAERVAQAFGDSQGAPRWLQGESLTQYRQRLLGKYKQHSANWKGVELAKLNADALDIVETQVYADAYQAATHPTSVEAGTLRSVTETDYTGRRITRFYGDPDAAWRPFKRDPRLVAGWTTKFN